MFYFSRGGWPPLSSSDEELYTEIDEEKNIMNDTQIMRCGFNNINVGTDMCQTIHKVGWSFYESLLPFWPKCLAKTVNSKSHTLQYRVIIIELNAKVKPANDHRATRRSTVGRLYIIAQCANV